MGCPTPADSPREWLSVPDPDEPGRTWLLDLTFLNSGWRCLYGDGCQGVLTEPSPERAEGCCSYGAHISSDAERRRVEDAAGDLPARLWQNAAEARRRGSATVRLAGGTARTRLVDGACVFLNRPGFDGGTGCALHLAATEDSLDPQALKPDVCWQLPLRRVDITGDDGEVLSTVREWGRRDWGEGGAEFAWWCTEAPAAFDHPEPVWRTLRAELEAMVGARVYAVVAGHLERRSDPVPVALSPRARDGRRD